MAIVTFHLDAECLSAVDQAAAWREMSREAWISAVLRHVSRQDAALEAKIQQGIDDADAGRLISQEDMEAWFEARLHQAAAE